MKIALIGTGKMGMAIEPITIGAGHEVVLRIGSGNRDMLAPEYLSKADIAIEFTRPDAVVNNLKACLQAGIPVVCGTTGWNKEYSDVRELFTKRSGALLTASNFSIGVNLLFELNRQLSGWMKAQPEYEASITEIHHIHKVDKPSGTALTIAEDLISSHHHYQQWHLSDQPSKGNSLPIEALREDEVVGTHLVKWRSEVDEIILQHAAFSRNGFALGAVKAAEWLIRRSGVFTFRDVLFPSRKDNE
jgi:4-hydroxy-tetrahydrodipicolinate reductase